MTLEEKLREQAIRNVVDILRSTPFTVEFEVKKHPKGVKITYEVTREQLDEMMWKAAGKEDRE